MKRRERERKGKAFYEEMKRQGKIRKEKAS